MRLHPTSTEWSPSEPSPSVHSRPSRSTASISIRRIFLQRFRIVTKNTTRPSRPSAGCQHRSHTQPRGVPMAWHARGQMCRPATEWSEAPAVTDSGSLGLAQVAELGGRPKKSDDQELGHDPAHQDPANPNMGQRRPRPATRGGDQAMVSTMPLAISKAMPGHPGLKRRPPSVTRAVGSRRAGPGSSCPWWSPRCEVEGDAGLAL
jgi:hypothetical protein